MRHFGILPNTVTRKMRNLTAKERLFCAISTLRSFYGRSTRDIKVILLSLSICKTKINNMCKICLGFCDVSSIKNVAATEKINPPSNSICHFNIQAKECQVLMNLFALWGHTIKAKIFQQNALKTSLVKQTIAKKEN